MSTESKDSRNRISTSISWDPEVLAKAKAEARRRDLALSQYIRKVIRRDLSLGQEEAR